MCGSYLYMSVCTVVVGIDRLMNHIYIRLLLWNVFCEEYVLQAICRI